MSPGFTVSIYPQNPEIVAVHGLTRTVITLPAPELAVISISANRRKILEKKYKNYKFATRAGERRLARLTQTPAPWLTDFDRGAGLRALPVAHAHHGLHVGFPPPSQLQWPRLTCVQRNTPDEAV